MVLLAGGHLPGAEAVQFALRARRAKTKVQGYHTKLDACKICFANHCDSQCLVGFCHKLYSEYTAKEMWCTECTSVMDATTTSLGFQNECSQEMNKDLPEQPWHSRWWYVHHEKTHTALHAKGPLLPLPWPPVPEAEEEKK